MSSKIKHEFITFRSIIPGTWEKIESYPREEKSPGRHEGTSEVLSLSNKMIAFTKKHIWQ